MKGKKTAVSLYLPPRLLHPPSSPHAHINTLPAGLRQDCARFTSSAIAHCTKYDSTCVCLDCRPGYSSLGSSCILTPGYYRPAPNKRPRACPAGTCSLGGLDERSTTSDKDSCTKDGCSSRPLNAWFSANQIAGGGNSRKQGPSKLTFSTKALIDEALDTSAIQLRGGGPSPKTKGLALECADDVKGTLLSHGRKIRVEPKEKGWDGFSACSLVLDNEGESVIHFHVCVGEGASSDSCKSLASLDVGDIIGLGCTAEWYGACPQGSRCLEVKNTCTYPTTVAYTFGCKPGGLDCNFDYAAPPESALASGASIFYPIINGPDACWTNALAVLPNKKDDCGVNNYNCMTCGTRTEITAGVSTDQYDHQDQYNIDVEFAFNRGVCTLPQNDGGRFYSIPVRFEPKVDPKGSLFNCGAGIPNSVTPPSPTLVNQTGNLCRPLHCNNAQCADAYCTKDTICPGCPPSTGIKQPQAACQETFDMKGYLITLCPTEPIPPALTDTKGSCQQRCCCGSSFNAADYNRGMIYPSPSECANIVCTAP